MSFRLSSAFATSFAPGGIEDAVLGLSWNASTLANEVGRRAAVLSEMGVGQGSVVAIAHGGTARFFADLFATWRLGATAACLDSSLTPGEIKNVVDFAKAGVVLVDGAVPFEHPAVPIVELRNRSAARSSLETSETVNPDAAALLLFTSGTTGAPKGVVLSFRALEARILANIKAIGRAPLERALVSLPTHFGHGLIGNSLTPLLAGGDIVLHPLGVPMANELGRIIDRQSITFMSSVPAFWRMALSRSTQPKGASLVRVHVGSAPFPPALWSEVVAWTDAEVVNCYGTTETANWIAGASSRVEGIVDGLVGSMWGGEAAVLDDDGAIHPVGSGEIVVRSPSLMSGYLDRPDLTAAAFHEGWYRTGDRGAIDDQGRLRLTGRIKDEINRAGFKVQPAEIDALLETNPAVAEACVFGVDDPLGGEAVAAAIRLKAGASGDAKGLQSWCLKRVRREAVPERWFFVSEIPRTSRGKVSRSAVRKALMTTDTSAADGPGAAPGVVGNEDPDRLVDAGSVRTAVEAAWTKVLGRDSYDAGLSLPETDADSLDVVRLWVLIEKLLGVQLSMDVLEAEPNAAQLAVMLEQQLRARTDPPDAPLVFLMLPARGDLPGLARFRTILKGKIRFALIRYPEWPEMIEAGGGFDALADAAVAQICTNCSESDPVFLAGYSFGGLVAMDAARRLMARGRQVRFVGLIDTRAVNPLTLSQRLRRFLSPRGKTQSGYKTREAGTLSGRPTSPPHRWHALISALILVSAFRPLKLLGRLATLLPEKEAFTIDSAINWRLRVEALRSLQLKRLEMPLTLFRSDDDPASTDYGWSALCTEVKVFPIGGTHELMLSSPYLDMFCGKFLDALKSASSTPGSLTKEAPLVDASLRAE